MNCSIGLSAICEDAMSQENITIELCGRAMRWNVRVGPLPSSKLGDRGVTSFFVRKVIFRSAPKLTLAILESRTTSIVLSECSDM